MLAPQARGVAGAGQLRDGRVPEAGQFGGIGRGAAHAHVQPVGRQPGQGVAIQVGEGVGLEREAQAVERFDIVKHGLAAPRAQLGQGRGDGGRARHQLGAVRHPGPGKIPSKHFATRQRRQLGAPGQPWHGAGFYKQQDRRDGIVRAGPVKCLAPRRRARDVRHDVVHIEPVHGLGPGGPVAHDLAVAQGEHAGPGAVIVLAGGFHAITGGTGHSDLVVLGDELRGHEAQRFLGLFELAEKLRDLVLAVVGAGEGDVVQVLAYPFHLVVDQVEDALDIFSHVHVIRLPDDLLVLFAVHGLVRLRRTRRPYRSMMAAAPGNSQCRLCTERTLASHGGRIVGWSTSWRIK